MRAACFQARQHETIPAGAGAVALRLTYSLPLTPAHSRPQDGVIRTRKRTNLRSPPRKRESSADSQLDPRFRGGERSVVHTRPTSQLIHL